MTGGTKANVCQCCANNRKIESVKPEFFGENLPQCLFVTWCTLPDSGIFTCQQDCFYSVEPALILLQKLWCKKKFFLPFLSQPVWRNLSQRKIPPWYFSVSISFKWCSMHPKARFAMEHFPSASLYLPLFHFRFVFPECFCKQSERGKKHKLQHTFTWTEHYLKSFSSEKDVFPSVPTVASLSFTVSSLRAVFTFAYWMSKCSLCSLKLWF